MGRAWLLRPSPQPACLRQAGDVFEWVSADRGRAARLAGDWRLYLRGHRRHRVRGSRGADRWECGACGGPLGRHHCAAARCAWRDCRRGGGPGVRPGGHRPPLRFRASPVRSWRHDLYPDQPGLRPVPDDAGLPCAGRWDRRGTPAESTQEAAPAPSRGSFLADRRGWPGLAAPPSAPRLAGRNDGTAGNGVAVRSMVAGRGRGGCPCRGVVAPGGAGRARLHPFRAFDRCLRGKRAQHPRGRFPAPGDGSGGRGAAHRHAQMHSGRVGGRQHEAASLADLRPADAGHRCAWLRHRRPDRALPGGAAERR